MKNFDYNNLKNSIECYSEKTEDNLMARVKDNEDHVQYIFRVFINGNVICEKIETEYRPALDRLIISQVHTFEEKSMKISIEDLKKYDGMEYEEFIGAMDDLNTALIMPKSIPEIVKDIKKEKYTVEYVDALIHEKEQLKERVNELEDNVLRISEENEDLKSRFLRVREFMSKRCSRIPFLGKILVKELKKQLGENELPEKTSVEEREEQ